MGDNGDKVDNATRRVARARRWLRAYLAHGPRPVTDLFPRARRMRVKHADLYACLDEVVILFAWFDDGDTAAWAWRERRGGRAWPR